ncbi:anthranilate synthase component I family protein [Microbacterium telephonicum]|uniref:Anthranilate synthase component 1 n=1 Tax=Microbacterium telephonicum TaxID=1714841 RepID=A0A498C2U9_9MICO|nr:anthranilate synthase component I family protein [Microbacterium telephonicum]RLK49523.1 anthranilate synthase component 1 [Microbacterium telephonicum]
MPEPLAARALTRWVDPAERFAAGTASAPAAFWLDAGPDARDGWSWLGTGEAGAVVPRDLACAETPAVREWGPFAGGWIGWLSYDAAAGRAGAPWQGDGAGADAGMRVDRFVAIDHARRRQWAVAPASEIDAFAAEASSWCGASPLAPDPAPTTAVARDSAPHYAALIERCRDAIREGDAYQLCLTTRFEVAGAVDAFAAYLRLRAQSPSHHGGFLRLGERALASSTPERFLEIGGGTVRTRPIKGTRPRGTDAASDAGLARELRESVKEQAENVMIVDLMRNDLQRVCRPGTVTAERLLEVESYPAVHQLVSTVAGRLSPGIRIGDVLDAAFPAGSMTGAPKLSAMTILHELENAPRGLFAGCFGWIGDDGAADLAMVIRSIVTHPGGAYVGAGGGITWRSEAAAEVAEVALKAARPLAAVGARLPPGW